MGILKLFSLSERSVHPWFLVVFLLLNLIYFGVVVLVIFLLAIVFSHCLSIDLLLLMTHLVHANFFFPNRYIRLIT